MHKLLIALPLLLALTACDQVQQMMGVEDLAAKAAKVEAEGKAVGGACRHSGRAIEDGYAIYHWLPKAPVFAGWQEMDGYMRTNNIETVDPQLPPPAAPGTRQPAPPKITEKTDKGGKTEKVDKVDKAEKADKAAEKKTEK